MDQSLQNRNLENCLLNDHKTQSLSSSIQSIFFYSFSPHLCWAPSPRAPNPLAPEASTEGIWVISPRQGANQRGPSKAPYCSSLKFMGAFSTRYTRARLPHKTKAMRGNRTEGLSMLSLSRIPGSEERKPSARGMDSSMLTLGDASKRPLQTASLCYHCFIFFAWLINLHHVTQALESMPHPLNPFNAWPARYFCSPGWITVTEVCQGGEMTGLDGRWQGALTAKGWDWVMMLKNLTS